MKKDSKGRLREKGFRSWTEAVAAAADRVHLRRQFLPAQFFRRRDRNLMMNENRNVTQKYQIGKI